MHVKSKLRKVKENGNVLQGKEAPLQREFSNLKHYLLERISQPTIQSIKGRLEREYFNHYVLYLWGTSFALNETIWIIGAGKLKPWNDGYFGDFGTKLTKTYLRIAVTNGAHSYNTCWNRRGFVHWLVWSIRAEKRTQAERCTLASNFLPSGWHSITLYVKS